jgi:hypothetical protein
VALPDGFKDWARSPVTREVLEWTKDAVVKPALDSLMASCSQSSDPVVRDRYSKWKSATEILHMMKGKPDERG